MKYILVNIGCIECRVATNIVGVFDDKEVAENLAEKLGDEFIWRGGGENSFQIFPMPEPNIIHHEYITESVSV